MKRICILLLAAAVLLSCTFPALAEEEISQQAAYVQGQKLLAEGQYAGAAFLFSAMEHYQDSTEYYFYACARLYEELGQTENACAIYLVMPWFEDCAQRAAALRTGEKAQVESAADASASQPVIGGGLDAAPAEPEAQEASTPDETEQQSTIGGGLAEESVPVQPEASVEKNDNLTAYHVFSGETPSQYDDYATGEGYRAVYYSQPNLDQVNAYEQLFEDQGWTIYSDSDATWQHDVMVAPGDEVYFYISYNESEDVLVLMYDSTMDYGFDPVEGL